MALGKVRIVNHVPLRRTRSQTWKVCTSAPKYTRGYLLDELLA